MEIIIFIAVVVIFYLINKDYKASDYQHINVNVKQKLKGKLIDHEAGLLIAMMAKVAKADGHICELEAELLSHTFTDISLVFVNNEEMREELKKIYSQQKESFDNTVEISNNYYKLTSNDYAKRVKVMEYLLNLAFIDGDFSDTERMIIEDIANALKIKQNDLNAIINQFKEYYASKQASTQMNLENAYKILDVTSSASDGEIKKVYRSLVKKYHPDIVTGQGVEQSMIDEATTKLQEINEAYELIKKSRK
ncbi:MAG TPA: molecular chaperone DjlA [Arcobacter sp.]|nr:molecular chaperone DjlA [Arcobacter sp.]HIP55609.1 molecular chaperone DjlA [Arcobacter sp.]